MSLSSAEFSVDDLRLLFGASIRENIGHCAGVCTDSRSIRAGELFVALRGEAFDGHNFVGAVLASGAAAAIVERARMAEFSPYLPLIPVEDTLIALGNIALFHRNRFNIPIIAIAGAAGKTSTKDLASHVLERKFNVLKTKKNHNNRIGVPQTLLQLSATHNVAVVEIGTNEPGEIAELCRIAQPTHGLITNIGKEHLEKLVDIDGAEREECSLFDALQANGGVALVNLDDNRLAKYSQLLPRTITFGETPAADIQMSVSYDKELHPLIILRISNATATAAMQTVGRTAALNAAAAAAVGAALGMEVGEIAKALQMFSPPSASGYGRMVIEQREGYVLINDCYNANPESVTAALHTLSQYPSSGMKIAVLGDMRELGEYTAGEHDAILEAAANVSDMVIAIGDNMREAAFRLNRENICISTKDDAPHRIAELLSGGAVLLVKGSRGLALEDIISRLPAAIQYLQTTIA